MIFLYDGGIIRKYLLFGGSMVLLALFGIPLIPLFNVPVTILVVLFCYFGFGALFRASKLNSQAILIDRKGIHFYNHNKLHKTLKWEIIEDHTISSTAMKLMVGNNFFHIPRELKFFDDLTEIVKQNLELPPFDRGKDLPEPVTIEEARKRKNITLDPAEFLIKHDGSSPDTPSEKLRRKETENEDEDLIF